MVRQKSLSVKYYNEFGLIDKNSEEFQSVKNLMDCRRYQLIESIGSGNYAEVYKAFHVSQKKDVVIKVFDTNVVNHKYGITFMSRAVDIIPKLNHKNVIKVFEVIQSFKRLIVVMELSPNQSVAQLLSKRGPFSELMSWLLFVSILDGLDYMHSKKLAHRNLKLENILLTENLSPKLSDFCFAIIVKQKKPNNQWIHNLGYLAPEVLQQLPHNPMISDIWSLGVCLFVMVSNTLPFKLEKPNEMIEKQVICDSNFVNIDSKLSNQLKEFFDIMLEPDMSLRPTTRQLLKHEWVKNEPSMTSHY